MADPLDVPLAEVSWCPPTLQRVLLRFNLTSWRALLEHYPRRYEDRSRFARFPGGATERPVCLRGIIGKVAVRYFGGRKIVEATLEEESDSALGGRVVCRWFNQHYVQRMLATGLVMIVFGRLKEQKSRLIMDHPEFELLDEEDDDSIHVGRITPIYPLTEGLKQRHLRVLMHTAVQQLEGTPDQPVLISRPEGSSLTDAFTQIHFPTSLAQAEEARQRLALAELVALRLVVEFRRRSLLSLPGQAHALKKSALLDAFLRRLPFSLTGAQKRAIAEIQGGMMAPQPMNRLLQGDVGAGKTVVAAAAMLLAKEAGFSSIFMAPTQVLAEQHFGTLREWLEPLRLRLSLQTGGRQEQNFLELAGEADVAVGTHALLYQDVVTPRVGLVVIDEQHKFGVLQRAKLIQRTPVPDLLVMTATPIPRTLAMTVYGDLEVSVLDEKPAHRRPIITRLRSSEKVQQAAAFVRERIAGGRQAYVVYPLIEESDAFTLKAATKEFAHWRELLAPFRCDLLHGKMPEKEEVMRRFRSGEIQALISTSVIEVGVDVPNATVMLIENAERFGLAQLHQLRGRIGRGRHQSYCVLLTEAKDADALNRLQLLEQLENGFEIAEADLRLRGPGDLLGTAQSGLPPLRLADLVKDALLLEDARMIAQEILEIDPALQSIENARFLGKIQEFGQNGASLAN